ncbi:class I adenylate-forming enzyme family protein [Nostoc sp. 'Peltigera membranacea cyanobiont' 210A]|uniref:class I adenylate-forming enzyme family protein n=1 Tax=Nostoc sp. 'Peltigera membranacea cyanobiont' 210A TaxID=2014529 RepID=UPI00167E4CD2|nr:class I adenylate-forming enzyme family protein [Nostoc sp. 'Peltigera membranacea cyanobiont' 210A]
MTVIDGLAERLNQTPNAPYLTAAASSGERRTLSYAEFDRFSRQAASWLYHEFGLAAGAIVGFAPCNDLASAATLFGALRSGVRVVFLDPEAPQHRQEAIMRQIGAETVLNPPPDLERLPPPNAEDAPLKPADDAFYFPTSGSTAASKIVIQTHRGAVANALAITCHHAMQPGVRLLGCLPIHHVNGFHFTLLATLFSGAHAMLAQGFNPLTYPRLLYEFRPHIASVVPSILNALLATWRAPEIPPDFRYFVSAAAPLTRETVRSAYERWGVRILQGYGLTETNNFSTTLLRSLSDACYRRQMVDTDIPTIGVAVQGNEVAILDASGRQLGPGERGEICVRGHNVMDGYAGNPEGTADAFKDGWFHTGDIGMERFDPEVEAPLFVVVGRKKNIAKVRGESVSLEEMERELTGMDGVSDAACVVLDDEMLGEAIAAVIVGNATLTDQQVNDHLRQMFAPSTLPRRILYVDAIPRTPTGKILRPALLTQIRKLL